MWGKCCDCANCWSCMKDIGIRFGCCQTDFVPAPPPEPELPRPRKRQLKVRVQK